MPSPPHNIHLLWKLCMFPYSYALTIEQKIVIQMKTINEIADMFI